MLSVKRTTFAPLSTKLNIFTLHITHHGQHQGRPMKVIRDLKSHKLPVWENAKSFSELIIEECQIPQLSDTWQGNSLMDAGQVKGINIWFYHLVVKFLKS